MFQELSSDQYADDTVIVGLISNNDESEYNEQISEVVQWGKLLTICC